MATLKHINSKNADYGAAEQYLLFEHDEFTMKPVLDEIGRLTHLNFHFHFIRNLKFKDGTIIQKVLMRSSREPEIIIYLFYWYFLRSLQSGCLSSGGNDILGWASGLPKLHTEVSAKDDLMSTQVV